VSLLAGARSGTPVAVTDTFLHLSDPGLIALIARGDRDAFAELYDRYGKTAYALAYRVTRDVQLAEEVVQEAFLTLWRQASRFDGRRAKPSTWLLTIAHHKAVDVVRREQLRRTEPAEEMEDAPDPANVPHEAWLGLQHDQVREALAALPDPQREVIELSYFEGYSQSELARRLGQPLGTIKSRTHTALTRLRAQLEERGITTENPWSTESSRT
jgi:RNA polymerase sigma factor (sigma-70 family)